MAWYHQAINWTRVVQYLHDIWRYYMSLAEGASELDKIYVLNQHSRKLYEY